MDRHRDLRLSLAASSWRWWRSPAFLSAFGRFGSRGQAFVSGFAARRNRLRRPARPAGASAADRPGRCCSAGSSGYVQLNGLLPFLNYIKTTPYQTFANYTLSVIPLFVLMGAFAERSGLATRPVPRRPAPSSAIGAAGSAWR